MVEKTYRIKSNNKLLIGLMIIIVLINAQLLLVYDVLDSELGFHWVHPAIPWVFFVICLISALIASFEKIEKVEIKVIKEKT